MGHLPELRYAELIAMLQHFGCTLTRYGGPEIRGRGTHGAPFSIHLHTSEPLPRQNLTHVLRQAGISREAFLDWYYHKR